MEDRLMDNLPTLTKDELRDLRSRIEFLLTYGPVEGKDAVPDAFVRLLHDALCDLLIARTGIKQAPFKTFSTTNAGKQFITAAKAASKANGQWFPKQTKAEQASMILLYAQIVLAHIDARGALANWMTIAYGVSNLPALVDQAFPGYVASGLLHKVQALRTQQQQSKRTGERQCV